MKVNKRYSDASSSIMLQNPDNNKNHPIYGINSKNSSIVSVCRTAIDYGAEKAIDLKCSVRIIDIKLRE